MTMVVTFGVLSVLSVPVQFWAIGRIVKIDADPRLLERTPLMIGIGYAVAAVLPLMFYVGAAIAASILMW